MGSGDHEGTEAMRFSSPSPSRVRSRASPSMTSSRQSQSLSSRSSRSSKQKKPSNKQPRGQVPRDTTVGVRGRVSVAERGRIVLEAMGSGAKNTTSQSTGTKQPLKDIVRLAVNTRWIEGAKRRLKERLYAASTMATKESKRRKIMEIMQNCEIKIQGNGLSVEELVTVAAVLRRIQHKER